MTSPSVADRWLEQKISKATWEKLSILWSFSHTAPPERHIYAVSWQIITKYYTLENRYGFWTQTGCVTVPGCEAAFLVARQRFPYRSRFNFSVKNMKNMLPCNTICDIMQIDFSKKYIVEQMMHPLAFNRSSLSQMAAHKIWTFEMFWDILRQ